MNDMTDRDTITLPREVVQFVLRHLEWWSDDEPQEKEAIEALRTALAAPPEDKRHPGYVIGSHWLETAYSRICAGEAEADVLRDIGLVRITDGMVETADIHAIVDRQEALRRENERLRDELRQSSVDYTRAENERLREALDKSLTDEQIRQIAASIDRSMPIEPAKILFARRIEAALRREET